MENILIFDCDGVIADSMEILMKHFADACRKNDFNKVDSKEEFLKLFEKNFYDSLADLGANKEKISKILWHLNSSLLNGPDKPKLFNGAKDMLKILSKNNKIVIVTSNVTQPVEELLKSNGIGCFEEVIGADKETSKIKKIESIKSRFKGYNYFYIGDTKGDIIEGKKANVRTIAVTWGFHSEEKLKEEKPDFIAHSPKELMNLLKRN